MAKPKGVPDPDDVRDVVREEESRGRRPIDTDEQRRRALFRQDLRRLFQIDRRQEFVAALEEVMLDREIELDSPLRDFAVQLWEQSHRP